MLRSWRRRNRLPETHKSHESHECNEIINAWMLRILIDLNIYKVSHIENETSIHQALGLHVEDPDELSKTEFLKLIKPIQLAIKNPKINPETKSNLKWLQQKTGLNNAELDILSL